MTETVTISKFKATCLALLARVKRTGEPIVVTRKGEPIAQVIPPPPPEKPEPWLGSFQGTGKIVRDIIPPATADDEWEIMQS
jgi:prevent-host-death family protein